MSDDPCAECGGLLVETCQDCGARWMTGAQMDRIQPRIITLERENATTKAARDRLSEVAEAYRNDTHTLGKIVHEKAEKIVALEADVARLREALEIISSDSINDSAKDHARAFGAMGVGMAIREIQQMAKRVLDGGRANERQS